MKPSILINFKFILRSGLILVLLAMLCAFCSVLFLQGLSLVGQWRQGMRNLIYALPLVGFAVAWLYQNYGQKFSGGLKIIQSEIHQPKQDIPWLMLPFILISTWLSHLFGASVGREGTALQMGGSLADGLCQRFGIPHQQRGFYLKAGLAAGFSAVFGTPLAALFFSLEFSKQKIKIWPSLALAATAWLSHYFSEIFGAPHSHYQVDFWPEYNFTTLVYVALAGLIFGQISRFYLYLQGILKHLFNQINSSVWRAFWGGILFLLAINFCGDQFLGLGLNHLQKAFQTQISPFDFGLKILLTLCCLSAGFKGGEVTPLFFIGACLGNTLWLFLPLPMGFLAAMGFVAVFSGCAKTPLACSFMALELFGFPGFGFALLVCFIATYSSGKKSIYD